MRAADAVLLSEGAHFRLLPPAPPRANVVTTKSKLCKAGTTTLGRTSLHVLVKIFIGLPPLQKRHNFRIPFLSFMWPPPNTFAPDAPPSASQARQILNYHYTNHSLPSFWRWGKPDPWTTSPTMTGISSGTI